MPLKLSNHLSRTNISPIFLSSFSKLQWFSNIASISKSHGHNGGASDLWFVKVICTLHVRRKSSLKEVCISDYLSKNLTASTAFSVIEHMNSKWNSPELAFSFLEYTKNMLNFVHSIETYSFLLRSFCQVGVLDLAKLMIDLMRIDGLLPDSCLLDSCLSVISGYCKLGKMEEALVLFNNMIGHGIRPSTITFNVIIDGFGKIGDMVSALNMYEKMLNLGCTPDVITFTSIIDGHCRLGNLHQALKILDEMNRRNLYPNIYTFSILINTLCKESRLKEARDLLRELKKRGDVVPKAFLYNPVIDGFCKAGNVDEANVIVKEMEEKKCKPDKLTYTILIIGHCMKGRMVEAINLFDRMIIVGCAPDSITVNSLVSRLLKAGMPKEAFEIKKAVSGMPITHRDVLYTKNVDIPVAM